MDRRKRAGGIRDFADHPMLLDRALADPAHGEAACRRVRERSGWCWSTNSRTPIRCSGTSCGWPSTGTPPWCWSVIPSRPSTRSAGRRCSAISTRSRAPTPPRAHHELAQRPELLADSTTSSAVPHSVTKSSCIRSRPHNRNRGCREVRCGCVAICREPVPGRSIVRDIRPSGAQRNRVARRLAADIVSDARHDADTLDMGDGPRPVEPVDIAVLVRTNAQVAMVHDALVRVGVPSVFAGGASVFATRRRSTGCGCCRRSSSRIAPTGCAWPRSLHSRAYTAEELDARGDDIVAAVCGTTARLVRVFAQSGFAAVFERLAAERRSGEAAARGLAGEREFTDLRHVAQLLECGRPRGSARV